MNASKVSGFDNFWRTITREETFIRHYGHTANPDWTSRSSRKLVAAYERIQSFLIPVSRSRMIYDLPGGMNPFEAENAHRALVLFMNPPERWFGQIGVLDSDEYQRLKKLAAGEEQQFDEETSSSSDPTDSDLSSGQESLDLNETEFNVLEAMDATPRIWKDIAHRAGYVPHTVRRYSTKLQKLGLIIKTTRGFCLSTAMLVERKAVEPH